jgi:hypothetical protein
MHILWLRRLGHNAIEMRVCRDELSFAFIPDVKDFGGWRTAKDTRVDEAGEAYAGDMARRAEYAFKVPDRFRAIHPLTQQPTAAYHHHTSYCPTVQWRYDLRFRIDLVQKPTAILF